VDNQNEALNENECCLFKTCSFGEEGKGLPFTDVEKFSGDDGEGYSWNDGITKLCKCNNCGALFLCYMVRFLGMSSDQDTISYRYFLPVTGREEALEYKEKHIDSNGLSKIYNGKMIWFNSRQWQWRTSEVEISPDMIYAHEAAKTQDTKCASNIEASPEMMRAYDSHHSTSASSVVQNTHASPVVQQPEPVDKSIEPCCLFSYCTVDEAVANMQFEIIEDFGKNDFYYGSGGSNPDGTPMRAVGTYEQGSRQLIKCEKCGTFFLLQKSTADYDGTAYIFETHYFQMANYDEAISYNDEFDGRALKRKITEFVIMNGNSPDIVSWARGHPKETWVWRKQG